MIDVPKPTDLEVWQAEEIQQYIWALTKIADLQLERDFSDRDIARLSIAIAIALRALDMKRKTPMPPPTGEADGTQHD